MAELIVPGDAVVLDGPVPGDPLRLLSPLTRALGREGPAVVVRTSGSTGRAKRTVLTRCAPRWPSRTPRARPG